MAKSHRMEYLDTDDADTLLDLLRDIDASEAVDLDVINAILRGEIAEVVHHG